MNGYDMYGAITSRDNHLATVYDRLHSFGAEADNIANIPSQFFNGIDIKSLNLGGLNDGISHFTTHRSISYRAATNEIFGHADAALTIALPGASLTLAILERLASRTQRERILSRLNSMTPTWGAFAASEPSSGSDLTRMNTTAENVVGGYELSGTKCFIGNGGRANYAIVFATIDRSAGLFGIRAFFVPLPSKDISIDDSKRMLGLRAVRVAWLTFNRCFIPDENVIGIGTGIDLSRTFSYAQHCFDTMRPCLASLIVGASQRVIDDLARGLDALNSHGSCSARHTIQRYAKTIESARLLCRYAAVLHDTSQDNAHSASIAKLYATKTARDLIDEVLKILSIEHHPHYCDFMRWKRDFQGFYMMEGTDDVHRLMISRRHSKRII